MAYVRGPEGIIVSQPLDSFSLLNHLGAALGGILIGLVLGRRR